MNLRPVREMERDADSLSNFIQLTLPKEAGLLHEVNLSVATETTVSVLAWITRVLQLRRLVEMLSRPIQNRPYILCARSMVVISRIYHVFIFIYPVIAA